MLSAVVTMQVEQSAVDIFVTRGSMSRRLSNHSFASTQTMALADTFLTLKKTCVGIAALQGEAHAVL